jgi:hypothetical protein
MVRTGRPVRNSDAWIIIKRNFIYNNGLCFEVESVDAYSATAYVALQRQ